MKEIGYIYAGESATLRFEARTEGEILDLSAYEVFIEISTTAMGPHLVKRSADGAVDLSQAARGTMFCALSAEDTASLTPGTATIGVRLLQDKKVQMAFDASIEILRQGATPSAVLSRTAEPVVALHTPCIWVLMNFGAARDGITPHIGENGNWYIGEQDTGVQAQGDSTPDNATESVVDRIVYDEDRTPDHYRARNFGVPAFEAGRTIFVVGDEKSQEFKSCFAKMNYNVPAGEFIEQWNIEQDGAYFCALIPKNAETVYIKASAPCSLNIVYSDKSTSTSLPVNGNGFPRGFDLEKEKEPNAVFIRIMDSANADRFSVNLYADHAVFRRGIYRSLGYGKWEKLPNRGLVVKQRGGRIVWDGQNAIFHEPEYAETAWFLRVRKNRVRKYRGIKKIGLKRKECFVGYICVGQSKEDLFDVLGDPDGGPAGRRSIMQAAGGVTYESPWRPPIGAGAIVEYADGFVATVKKIISKDKGYSAIPRKVLYRFKVRTNEDHSSWVIVK